MVIPTTLGCWNGNEVVKLILSVGGSASRYLEEAFIITVVIIVLFTMVIKYLFEATHFILHTQACQGDLNVLLEYQSSESTKTTELPEMVELAEPAGLGVPVWVAGQG